jgi:hypothetical protein
VSRRERIGRLLPAPLAAVVILLVALIVITPVLLSSGQPVPGILTQADLIVDRVPGSNVTHFYVRGVGINTRYTEMSIAWATNFTWGPTFPSGPLSWRPGVNGTDVLTIVFASTANPVALNISAFYQASGGSAYYVGELALNVASSSPGASETLYLASGTSGLTASSSYPVSSLPIEIPLVNVGSGP